MTTKNDKAKQRKYREAYFKNLEASGFKRLMFTVHVDDVERIKKYIRKLNNSRR